jgi:hypothetical protein
MRHLVDGPLELPRKLSPLRPQPRNPPDRDRRLDPAPVPLEHPPPLQTPIRGRNRVVLLGKVVLLLVKRQVVEKLLPDLAPALRIRRRALFGVAKLHHVVEFFGALLDLFAYLRDQHLDQRRPAYSLLHPQLAALHLAGKVHFALPRQQRDGAHFAQIHAYRVVRVNGLLRLLRRLKIVAVMHFFRVEKLGILVERKP